MRMCHYVHFILDCGVGIVMSLTDFSVAFDGRFRLTLYSSCPINFLHFVSHMIVKIM